VSDKNLEQRINTESCVQIGSSARETSALLAVAYGGYAKERASVFEWHSLFKQGRCADRVTGLCSEEKTRILELNCRAL
jgi:hypothetical protein